MRIIYKNTLRTKMKKQGILCHKTSNHDKRELTLRQAGSGKIWTISPVVQNSTLDRHVGHSWLKEHLYFSPYYKNNFLNLNNHQCIWWYDHFNRNAFLILHFKISSTVL